MSVLVYLENIEGKIIKPSLEALTYGRYVSQSLGTKLYAVSIGKSVGNDQLDLASKYGAHEVYSINSSEGDSFSSAHYTAIIAEVAGKVGANVIVLSATFAGKSTAGRLQSKLKAGLVSGVISLPDTSSGGFIVKKGVYSGKGFAFFNISSKIKIITVSINSFKVEEQSVNGSIIDYTPQNLSNVPTGKVIEKSLSTGKVSLSDAEIVISGGRGLKGPENWHLVEDLANLLGAATACSKPVSDMHWRPHSEHVGQTGLTVSPNLYIAIGISGAIQHLAGVSSSKVIVAINKDAEAPFFKAADYGIVGDAFEILPKLIEATRKIKA